MAYIVEVVVNPASGNVLATPRTNGTGTAAVGGYAITQIAGNLHTITIAEPLLGPWVLVAGDGLSQRAINFLPGIDEYLLGVPSSVGAVSTIALSLGHQGAVQLTWPLPDAVITGTIRWPGQEEKPLTGAITFRETAGDVHFYDWVYAAEDRPDEETWGIVMLSDSTAVAPPLLVSFTDNPTGTNQSQIITDIGDSQTAITGAISAAQLVAADVWSHTPRTVAEVTSPVTVGTNNDKTDYSLSAAGVTAIEAALINEGDGQQLINAILQVINTNLDVPALELTAIAQAVRSELTTELARIDAAISSRLAAAGYMAPDNASISAILVDTGTALPGQIAGLNDLSAAEVRSAVGLAAANLDTQLSGIIEKTDELPDPISLRQIGDETPVLFTFPTGSLLDENFTKTRRISGGAPVAVQGEITYLYELDGRHWYALSYNANDRPSAPGIVQYVIADGADDCVVQLQVVDAPLTTGKSYTHTNDTNLDAVAVTITNTP